MGIGLIAGWISTGSHDGDSPGPPQPWDRQRDSPRLGGRIPGRSAADAHEISR